MDGTILCLLGVWSVKVQSRSALLIEIVHTFGSGGGQLKNQYFAAREGENLPCGCTKYLPDEKYFLE